VGTARRRLTSVPLLLTTAVALAVLLPVWLPMAVAADLVRGRRRVPIARLLVFALGWSWLETAGVATALWFWITGRSGDHRRHYALQRWWAAHLMSVLRRSTGLTIDVTGVEALSPGPVVVLCRHASLADSLVSAWVVTTLAGKRPRYVLKRELLLDPCLDVVGNRLPNHFLDREAADSAAELGAITELAADLGPDDVAIIFPEGTRAAPAKRTRALARIAERDPERAARLAPLRHLLPPRPAGTAALLAGSPSSDVVIAWHTGFEGLDTFGGILRSLARGAPNVRFAAIRVPRDHVPSTDDVSGLTTWLDERWLDADRAVGHLLDASPTDRA
jgi:1-acyl-sn-glycerol-3-phosphate acyltransferase